MVGKTNPTDSKYGSTDDNGADEWIFRKNTNCKARFEREFGVMGWKWS